MHKRTIVMATLALMLLASCALQLLRPPFPEQWKSLQKGGSIDQVKLLAPDLSAYGDTLSHAQSAVVHFGMRFTWTCYFHFDQGQQLTAMECRSRNDWSGLLDARFEL